MRVFILVLSITLWSFSSLWAQQLSNSIKIEAEDYTNYYDATSGNSGGAYRNGNVDIQSCSEGGYNVGWIAKNEWLEYEVTLSPGVYQLDMRLATPSDKYDGYNIYIDGNKVKDADDFDKSGSWQDWFTKTSGAVTVTQAGTHTIRIEFTAREFNFNWFTLTEITQTNQIEAEDYARFYKPYPFRDWPYRNGSVAIESSPTGYHIAYINTDEWLEFDVALAPGKYTAYVRVASMSSNNEIQYSFNGVSFPNTKLDDNGGPFNWVDYEAGVVTVANGSLNTVRIDMLSNPNFNIDNITFIRIPDAPTPVEVHGHIHVNGSAIEGQNGPVQLRGVSTYWSNWHGKYFNGEIVQWLSDDWNIDVVRAHMAVDFGSGYIEDPAVNKARIFDVVDGAIEAGRYAIISWHADKLFDYIPQAQAFFAEAAARYSQYPNVFFEIAAEPTQYSWSSLKSYADQIIPSIRPHTDNLIIMGTPNWNQNVDEVVSNTVSDMNIVYSLNFIAGAHDGSLKAKATYALNNNVPLFVTQWKTTDLSGYNFDEQASKGWIDFMFQNRISWVNGFIYSSSSKEYAALKSSASSRGNWELSDLTEDGLFIRNALLNPPSSLTPVDYYGDLSTSGAHIISSNTHQPTQLRGASLFWSNWSAAWYNASIVNWLKTDWNSDMIRAKMAVTESGGYLEDPVGNTESVIRIIDAAIDKGIYVIVTWHINQAAGDYLSQAQTFFSEIAQTYGQYDNVIFEIYGQPTQIPWNEIKTYTEAISPSIRQYSDNLIIVGTPNWNQEVNQPIQNSVNVSNVVYALNFAAGTHGQYLRDNAQYAIDNDIPLFVSSWQTPDASSNGAPDFVESRLWTDFLNSNHISWCNYATFNKTGDTNMSVYPWASPLGNWSSTDLTPNGVWVRDLLRSYP
ncbi:MAG: cellulase family glycosylhydrolase [Fibrobacterales bacterium]